MVQPFAVPRPHSTVFLLGIASCTCTGLLSWRAQNFHLAPACSRVLRPREIINRLGSTCMQGTACAHAPSGLTRMHAHACNQASSHSSSLMTHEQATLSFVQNGQMHEVWSMLPQHAQTVAFTHTCAVHASKTCTHPVAQRMVYADARASCLQT